jgi:hypothetical protein
VSNNHGESLDFLSRCLNAANCLNCLLRLNDHSYITTTEVDLHVDTANCGVLHDLV